MEEDAILAKYYRYMIHTYHMAPDISEEQLGIILDRFYTGNRKPPKEPVSRPGQ